MYTKTDLKIWNRNQINITERPVVLSRTFKGKLSEEDDIHKYLWIIKIETLKRLCHEKNMFL